MGQAHLNHHRTPQKEPLRYILLLLALLVLLGCSLFTSKPSLRASVKSVDKRPPATATPTATPTPTPTPRPLIGLYLPFVAESKPPMQAADEDSDPDNDDRSLDDHPFGDLEFQDYSQRIRIKIYPPNKKVNRGKPIVISFRPGVECRYEDNKACVYTYPGGGGSLVTMITVHSGVGGDAQSFRHAIEGTGVSRAGFSLGKVQANLVALDGAEVVITQGKNTYYGFTLVATARLPAKDVFPYFKEPVENALPYAAAVDHRLTGLLNEHQPLIIFETCGWRMPGEKWVRGLPNTSGSVYMGVIQKKADP